jgi:hypothetical protein
MKLLEFFQEDNGNLSSVRLFNFAIIASAIIDWQRAVWTMGKWSPDIQVVALVFGILGLKVWQKGGEEKPGQPGVPQ